MTNPDTSFVNDTERWQRALEAAGLGVWDWNLKTNVCIYSESWCRMLGYRRSDFSETDDLFLLLIHPDDRERAIESGDRHLAGKTDGIETELRLQHKAGHWVWVLDRGAVIERDEDGNPVRVIGVQTDITQQKQVERDTSLVNERFRLALTAAEIGIWHFDVARGRSFWDAKTCEIFGLDTISKEIDGDTWHTFLHPEDRHEAETKHFQALSEKSEVKVRYRIVRQDGEIRHLETLAKSVPNQGGAGYLVGTIRDVTAEVEAARALQTEKERYEITLGAINDAVVSTDVDGVINFANPSAATMFSMNEQDLIGTNVDSILQGKGKIRSVQSGKQSGFNDDVVLEIDGSFYRCRRNPILDTAGERIGQVYTSHDITSDYNRRQQLAYAAHHDSLTGLYNRVAFDDALEEAIQQAGEARLAIFYLDLDHFKALNDFAGHAAGDKALKAIAEGITALLPEGAFFARLGGDEFAILLTDYDRTSAENLATETIAAVRDVSLSCAVNGPRLGCSIGIFVIDDASIGASDALARADDACYAAKSAGRNRHAFFIENGSTRTSGLSAAREVADLTEALEDQRLILFGQEIRSLQRPNEQCGRLEILARLKARDGRIVGPGAFIPAAERFGMAAMLDRWIIRKALSEHGQRLSSVNLKLGFNLSAQTLCDPTLWPFVKEVAEENCTPLSQIAFEITETAAVSCFETAELFVRSARRHGCTVSLDDFGSGLSSFDYLRRFPVSCIKIDGAFVEKIVDSNVDRAIIASIMELARNLGFDVVAEKIENEKVVTRLRQLGVAYGQGFHLHKPEPLDDIIARRSVENGRMAAGIAVVGS
ncbi:MAG: EAL domain-containing protein [Hoeflea sp.]|uniref:EAL domain-containing protein n=1 Tax=Hoeflea sp. TaxID=1940281 RepID=UPI0032ECDF1B